MIQTFQQQPVVEYAEQLLIMMEISRHQGNMKEGKAYQLKDFSVGLSTNSRTSSF